MIVKKQCILTDGLINYEFEMVSYLPDDFKIKKKRYAFNMCHYAVDLDFCRYCIIDEIRYFDYYDDLEKYYSIKIEEYRTKGFQ